MVSDVVNLHHYTMAELARRRYLNNVSSSLEESARRQEHTEAQRLASRERWLESRNNAKDLFESFVRGANKGGGMTTPVVGRCKLDPSLKATWFQPLNLRFHSVLSTWNLVF